MNTEQAKQIRIEEYLSRIGIMPAKERGHNLWYFSPFRNESEPSLKVNRNINQWHDFGSGEKGNIIDLAMKLHNTNSVSEALQAIERAVPITSTPSFSFRQQDVFEKMENVIVQPLSHPALIQLLNERKIPTDLAQNYCKEVHYLLNGKHYFAIAFPNDKGGYETLNPYFKGCIPPKEITTFDRKTATVNLFEGFMDYLSLLTLQAKQADVSAVVLNSVNNLEKAVPFLSKHSIINAFLDNDEAGKQALKKLQKLNLPVTDISKRYADFKDVNDYLCGKKMPQFQKNQTVETETSKPKIGKRFRR
ncbi:MAG: toprim domain-containing protein [Bacteroidia bacterium]|nr:toprim domain-containing protein [Bacteroidia bacterium]